ncbi:hypothetical protein Vadar_033040 [Vaccinium darrowii]|uniref:Uncharacterized protein n=1 Tax=Vaccinium darrowii TaxID=229202 RepID=A0ACB7XLK7_9ERIC|nr:hypothetical protein Vadar_033040 [Vaccinium darrowii]
MSCVRKVFDEMTKRSQVSWTALICGYARKGDMDSARELFDKSPKKDSAAYNGLVEEGKMWFKAMGEFGLMPKIEHYGCMVDLLGRAGCLEEAEK